MITTAIHLSILLVVSDPSTMAANGVLPVATPDHVRTYMDALGLDQQQLDTVQFVIEDYQDSMRDMHQAMLDRVAASRAALDDAFAGRRRMSMDAIRSLREDVDSAPRETWPEVDAALSQLTQTLAVLSADAPDRVESAKRAFMRRVLLDSVIDDGTAASAAMGFDLTAVVSQAQAEELVAVDQSLIEAALGPWRAQIDAQLQGWVVGARAANVEDALAEIASDNQTRLETMRASAQRWRDQTAVHAVAINEIAGLAQASGGDAARAAWLQRAHEARFPGLYDDHRLQVTSDWVSRNGSDAQREAVVQAHQLWVESCRPVAAKMADLLRQGFEQGVDLQHDAVGADQEATELRRTFLQASGDRQVRLETAKASIDRHLTEGQRAAVRRVIMDPRRR